MTVTVVGTRSFIARALREARPDWRYHAHDDIQGIDKESCIINCAFAPELRTGEYDAAHDLDARLSSGHRGHYMMLSSRLVYGVGQDRAWSEADQVAPHTHYARNKWRIEENLRQSLATQKLTVLRFATLCGHERARRSFFGIALDSLCGEGRISLDMASVTRRDFMPINDAVGAIVAFAENPAAGLFNVGSGFGTPCGDIAQALIRGYESGYWQSDDAAGIRDAFWLDCTLMHAAYPHLRHLSRTDILKHAEECGRWARTSGAQWSRR